MKRLLMEGYQSGWIVTQKETVEVELPPAILEREGHPSPRPQVVQRTRVVAQIQEADTPNQNNRRYPTGLWEKCLTPGGDFVSRLENREVLGEVEHPESGNTSLARVSHLWERVWQEGNKIMGQCLILDTPEGRRLNELCAVGHPLGFSSRGRGETFTAHDGLEEVKDDYFLDTFDAVAKPSVVNARTHNVIGPESHQAPTHTRTESIEESVMTANAAGISNAATLLGRVESTMAGVQDSLGGAQDVTSLVESQAAVAGLLAEMGSTPIPNELRESFAEARGKLHTTSQTIRTRLHQLKERRGKKKGDPVGGSNKAAQEIIEELTKRNRALKRRLAERARPVVDDSRYETSIQLGEELLTRARKLQAERDEYREKYEAACELMEAIVRKQKDGKVAGRIKAALQDSVIRNNPEARALLESCRTPQEVDRAVKLISSLVKGRTKVRDPLPPLGGNGVLAEGAEQPNGRRGLPVQRTQPQFSGTLFGRLAEREANSKNGSPLNG